MASPRPPATAGQDRATRARRRRHRPSADHRSRRLHRDHHPRSRAPLSDKNAQVLGDAHFDLTRPPSRDEAGMAPGRAIVTYERRPQFRVRIVLPEGKQPDVDANLAVFSSGFGAGSTTAAPETLDIHHDPGSLKDGLARLLADARTFDLDTQAVLDWYEEAGGPPPKIAGTVRSTFITTKIGYLTLDVQARYDRPYAPDEADHVVVHYLFSWSSST